VEEYRLIADKVAADIAAGRLRPGEQLPPQRAFARGYGIANSTAARVYGELIRRGLIVGEVGRGTFVRAAGPRAEPALAEPAKDPTHVDLELNFPMLADQPALLAPGLARLLRPDVLAETLRPVGAAGTPAARQAAATLLSRAGWAPSPERILFAGNGRQAIAAAIAAFVPIGERLGVESLTYPVVKAIAARLGVTLVPIAMDEHGMVPAALRAAAVRTVYLQPTLHNPLGVTMPDRRRAEIAEVLRQDGRYAIEDTVNAFLHDGLTPLAALAPEHTVLVGSLSKLLAPGLTLGLLATPAASADRVAAALRSGGWVATGFALTAATGWIADGTAATIAQAKRREAAARQEMVRERLAGFAIRADPHAFHCWWELPEPWRAETFVAAAARRGIAVTPAAAFAVGPGHAPNAVRLALATPARASLASALDALAALARATPEYGVE
jgi:DNA-binding transcriptional MocR family regulator